ncbi:hypothetical protein ADUPG1_011758 [Aduncisulcus paluster]|uniref:Uncharacterized protein n=1 Tax=Aduncisulcus paluster TaxID=2918883 RepID=A0ABQ5JX22_9EUKA|nr:hypothetical protein ADUPG1_011758 [Aduncisulcus paluster]
MKLINLSTDEKDNEEGRKEGKRRKGEEGKVVKREESSGYTMGTTSKTLWNDMDVMFDPVRESQGEAQVEGRDE